MKSEIEEQFHDKKDHEREIGHEEPSTKSLEGSIIIGPEKRKLFGIFIVNEKISYVNLISYLFACFLTICLVVYLSVCQNFVLTVILRIYSTAGNVTGSLTLYDELVALPSTLAWGVLSDRVGRRYVYSIGFVFMGTAMVLYSLVENVYPQMLLCRLLFSMGVAACTCMMTGTLGDVAGGVHERGRVSALVGILAGIGGVVAGMVLIKVPFQLGSLVKNETEGLRLSLVIVGGCAIGLAFIFAFTMPNVGAPRGFCFGKRWASGDDSIPVPKKKLENPFQMLKYGILAGRDPRIALAYFSSFVARADTVLFTSYMSLWVIQHYVDIGYCRDSKTCYPAAGDTHTLTGIGQGISLLFAPLFGYAGEKFKKSTVLGVAGIIGAVGSLPFAFTKEAPAAKSNFVFVTMVGIGQIGIIVTGMTLVNGTYVDPRFRGSVAGVFSFCGAVSIMIMAKLGGYLFDVWMRGAPFVLMGIAHVLIALMSLYTRLVTPGLEKRDREMFAKEAEMEKEDKED
ncbi:hypothetical protein BG011_006100 [Mortierella polycephala]|uniref:Major facilitator superfamily (MFS) profile domain-containing protein n=1 Tax=Mortierella polycephala TaxID=41804 RepID=A0A9P6PVJ7_9FUNG|nr:hypothetical protein BG011_006100 [Mortierella polycephala]